MKEIGSTFHSLNHNRLILEGITPFNEGYELFYSGRHALKFILEKIQRIGKAKRIWFPNYYCRHVINWIKKDFPNLYFYDINPFDINDIPTFPDPLNSNEVVILNNFWGINDLSEQIDGLENPLIVEDHSHGWQSKACLESTADYCFASLRKSLPIPFGGIYWEPGSNPDTIGEIPGEHFYMAWDQMLNAMELKTNYLKNPTASVAIKESFLDSFMQTEKFLDDHHEIVGMRNQDIKFIQDYFTINTLKAKKKNFDYFNKNIKPTSLFKVLHRENYTSFGIILLFQNKEVFLDLKNLLIKNDIYPAHLWPDNPPVERSEWNYLLNLHIDYRYNKKDISYMLKIINSWIQRNQNSTK